ncbi:MAG: hypothetical protein IPN24_07170 [Betaproteobacteria bacterium]|nr:hypothetical protein [Betaproteobacteria bacterium]MBK8688219.1 hypothetical protein [Betaproteobacteria bacterium]
MQPHRLVLAALVCSLTVPALAQDQPVTPKEIQETWVGKTLSGTNASGGPVTMKMQADGSASVAAGSTSDTGSWRLSDQGYCTTWKTIRAGQERCFTARRAGTRVTVLNPDGSVSGYFTEIR